jgi:DNA-damage-inducible protein D
MLGEKATTEITKETDSQGLKECKKSAKEGGNIAKNTRKEIEKKTGKSLISKENYINIKTLKS